MWKLQTPLPGDGLVENLTGDAITAFWGSGITGPEYVTRTIHILKAKNYAHKFPEAIWNLAFNP